MYCEHCGKQLANDAVVCIGCGRPIRTQPVLNEPNATQQAELAQYAGFWKRVAAFLIDYVLYTVVGWSAVLIIVYSRKYAYGTNTDWLHFINLILIVINWLYFALMESSKRQATLGKLTLGIVVTDLDGNRISFGKATGRHFGKIASYFTIFAGFIMVAFTARKQGLHDMMTGCLVVNKNALKSS